MNSTRSLGKRWKADSHGITKWNYLDKNCPVQCFLLKASGKEELVRAQKLLDRTENLLAQIPIIPFDQKAGVQFERLNRIKKARKIGRADILIASIVLANKAVLVTRNIRHFKQISGLSVKNWVD
jgi:tRNA(fMet)-specific endonuclease VapC